MSKHTDLCQLPLALVQETVRQRWSHVDLSRAQVMRVANADDPYTYWAELQVGRKRAFWQGYALNVVDAQAQAGMWWLEQRTFDVRTVAEPVLWPGNQVIEADNQYGAHLFALAPIVVECGEN